MKMRWYSWLVTQYPFVLIVFDIVLVGVCGPLAFWFHGVPTFNDPREGFETRGTTIRGRSQAALELQRQVKRGNLSVIPAVLPGTHQDTKLRNKRHVDGSFNMSCLSEPIVFDFEHRMPRMVVQATEEGANLLEVNHLKAICDVEDKYISPHFVTRCRGHSLPYYIAETHNKTCSDLTAEDVRNTLDLLQSCANYFHNGTLKECYLNGQCSGIAAKCFEHHVVYKILFYLTDVHVMADVGSGRELKVIFSQIIFRPSWLDPAKQLKDVRDYYLANLDNVDIVSSDGLVESKAMDMLIEIQIFNDYVISDLPFYGLAMFLVLLTIILYMRSVILTLVILIVVAFTILTAYFFYTVVFRFPFFPFINVLAALLCIAVGADDVFILRDIWNSFVLDKDGKENDTQTITSLTLTHGALSIFVTSLTTAAALFANYVSDITSLKCFSVFAGICILLNFFFMITFVPPILVLISRIKLSCCCKSRSKRLTDIATKVWSRLVPNIVIKLRYFWLLLFLSVGVSGIVLVFFKPQLKLPTSEMRIFYPKHHFEVYRDQMTNMFAYELELKDVLQYNVHLQFVWGMDSEDNGSKLDPQDNGTFSFHDGFTTYTKSAQAWNKEMCSRLLNQTFVLQPEKYICFFDIFSEIVSTPCNSTGLPLSPCCGLSYPLEENMANICTRNINILTSMHILAESRKREMVGFPIYDNLGYEQRAFTLVVPSTYTWTTLYDVTHEFHDTVEKFVQMENEKAPPEIGAGWWCGARGDFFYYDLQQSLSSGTYMGMGLSLAVGCLVLLFTSRNVLITIYSIFTIALTIATTVGILVLIGWELGFFESITITLAVGLSIDFTIHYGVAYLLAGAKTRTARVTEAVSKVGSAVAMASLTTFIAGSAVMGGRVLGYRNFGVFLMIVMAVSWSFSTFFFLSLCAWIGPLGKCGDLRYMFQFICRSKKPEFDHKNSKKEVVNEFLELGCKTAYKNGDIKNTFVKSSGKQVNNGPSYFQSLNDIEQNKLKEMARPSRLAYHNMNSNESIFNSNTADDTDDLYSASENDSSLNSAGEVNLAPRSSMT